MEKIPKKGYYLCTLTCPSAGKVRTAVKISRGKIIDYMGTKQDPSKLSGFVCMPDAIYVKYFSVDAVKELRALRKRVEKLEQELYTQFT